MGLTTLTALVATAFIAGYFHPYCNCITGHEETPEKALVIKNSSQNNAPWKKIRLPETILPESYYIGLRINISESHFFGHIDIKVSVIQETSLIVFHVFESLSIKNIRLSKYESGYDVPIKELVFVKKLSQLNVVLESAVSANEKLEIHVYYESALSTELNGLYKSTYKTESGQTRTLAVTHFEPTRARKAFPCFDEPALKAHFQLSIRHDAEFTSLSNMPQYDSVIEPDGSVTDHFVRSLKMSTYLVALLVSDYDHIEKYTQDQKVKIRVDAPEDDKDDLHLALDAAANITQYYATFFATPFPLPKQDLVAIPDFEAGAMENWGMITYRMVAILYNSHNSDSQKQYVTMVIAHELAHQWFGNLVTMKWWNDLWLNEGFATFVEYIGTENFQPENPMMEQFIYEALEPALQLDGLATSHPISVPVSDPAEINSVFDDISYKKGASIIRMLRSILTPDVFQNGLKEYLNKYKYSNAESADLWEEFRLASVAGGKERDVKAMMDTWTLRMGYPLMTVTRVAGDITVTQKHFLLSGSKDISHLWIAPITYVTNVDKSDVKSEILKTKQETYTVDASATWVKVNWGYEAMMRVNYDDDNWNALIQQLTDNHTVFDAFDRTNLISDLFALALSGDNTYNKVLDASVYLYKETSYAPWVVAGEWLTYVKYRLATSEDVSLKWKIYMLALIVPRLTHLGFDDTGSLNEKKMRSMLWLNAAKLGYEPAVTSAKNQFQEFMDQETHDLSSLNPNTKSVIVYVGVMSGGEDEWNLCWDLYQTTTDPSDLSMLRHALGMTNDKKILENYLDYALDASKIRLQDVSSVIAAVASNPNGSALAWDFFVKHYKFFYQHFGVATFHLSSIVKAVTNEISTQEKLDAAKLFFDGHDMGSAKLASKQAIEKMTQNVAWLTLHLATFDSWLDQHAAGT